jgi:hypothetical protein
MRQASEEVIPAIVMDNGLANNRAQRRHALPKPGGDPAAVKGKIGATGSSCHAEYLIREENQT